MEMLDHKSTDCNTSELAKEARTRSRVTLKLASTWRKLMNIQAAAATPERSRSGIISREGWKLEISEEEVHEVANWHEKCVRGPLVLTDLPKFDDTTNYGINAEGERELVKLEIRRLINDTISNQPLLFNSGNVLGSTNSEAFQNFSHLAEQILCNLSIVTHDNQLLIFENCTTIRELARAAELFKFARATLRSKFQQNDKVGSRMPTKIEPEQDNSKLYFALVDYITSTVARVMLRLASSKFWKNANIAVLARWSVKLKALSHDPMTYARQALSNGEAIVEQLNASDDREIIRKVNFHFVNKDKVQNNSFDVHEDADATQVYFDYSSMIRYRLYPILKASILSLYSGPSFVTGPTTFEVCTIVYEAGLSHSLTAISGDRDGDVFATSQAQNVNCSYVVQKLLLENVEALKEQRIPGKTQEQTIVKWQWLEGRKQQFPLEKSLGVSNSDDIVSILVLLSLSTSHVTEKMLSMITSISVNSEDEDPMVQFAPKHFQSKFVVSTADFLSKQHRIGSNNQLYTDPEVIPVSGNLLSKRIRAGTKLELQRTQEMSFLPTKEKDISDAKKEAHVVQQYLKDEKIMQGWIFAETTVTVKCRGYITLVMVICTVILAAGLAVPFTVQNRILGVDPFQITTFAWLIIGVVLIVAKTRYVTEWPWHDFLHGRVVCQSVSDLAEVTGVDSQMILTRLLYSERNTTLITRGPYNGMFSRRTEANKASRSDGFSIDVAVQLSTMFASGFIILKVLSSNGEHLITLDVRKGTNVDYASHDGVRVKCLACLDLGKRYFDEDEDDIVENPSKTPRVLYLLQGELHYTKVLGLYVCDSLFG